jgi:hypothetical protein
MKMTLCRATVGLLIAQEESGASSPLIILWMLVGMLLTMIAVTTCSSHMQLALLQILIVRSVSLLKNKDFCGVLFANKLIIY